MNRIQRFSCGTACLTIVLTISVTGCQSRVASSTNDKGNSTIALQSSVESSLQSASISEVSSLSSEPDNFSQKTASSAAAPQFNSASKDVASSTGAFSSADGSVSASAASSLVSSSANGPWNLVLVNAKHPMQGGGDIETAQVQDFKVDKRIAPALAQMVADAGKAGLKLHITSGYRPYSSQERLYNQKVQEYISKGYSKDDAAKEAAKWVAPPGTSEHNTGLAADIVSADYFTKYSDLLPVFETFPEAIWMKENCAKYGFILRYLKGKEDITGINFEPWHFRYVGVDAAKDIMAKGITLEEYLDVMN